MAGRRDLPGKMSSSMPDTFDVIDDTTAHAGTYYGIMCWDAPTFNATGMKDALGNAKDMTDADGIAPNGLVIPCGFSQIQLASGVVWAFKR